jgi:cytochrome b561
VLGLALLRVLWRIGHPAPPYSRPLAPWEHRLAAAAHGFLYLLILGLPLSGWIYDSAWKDAPSFPIHFFGLFDWPRIGWVAHAPPETKEKLDALFGGVHTWLGYVFYGAFVLHVAGALKHSWIDKQSVLPRMSLAKDDERPQP